VKIKEVSSHIYEKKGAYFHYLGSNILHHCRMKILFTNQTRMANVEAPLGKDHITTHAPSFT